MGGKVFIGGFRSQTDLSWTEKTNESAKQRCLRDISKQCILIKVIPIPFQAADRQERCRRSLGFGSFHEASRGYWSSPLSQPVVQGLAHAEPSAVFSPTGNSMIAGACCWDFWKALMILEVQLRNGTGCLQLSPMHPAGMLSLSSSLLWFTCVTLHKLLNKQHLAAICVTVTPEKPYL